MLQLLVSKVETFIMKLTAGFTMLPNLKKFTEGNWRNRDKKIADKFQILPDQELCVWKQHMLYKHHGAPEIEQRRARTKNENHIEQP